MTENSTKPLKPSQFTGSITGRSRFRSITRLKLRHCEQSSRMRAWVIAAEGRRRPQ